MTGQRYPWGREFKPIRNRHQSVRPKTRRGGE